MLRNLASPRPSRRPRVPSVRERQMCYHYPWRNEQGVSATSVCQPLLPLQLLHRLRQRRRDHCEKKVPYEGRRQARDAFGARALDQAVWHS